MSDHEFHAHTFHDDTAELFPADPTRRCQCLGVSNVTGEWLGNVKLTVDFACDAAATGIDGYCDRCRNVCIPRPSDPLEGVIPKGDIAPLSGIDVPPGVMQSALEGKPVKLPPVK